MKIHIHIDEHNELRQGVYNLGFNFRYDHWIKQLVLIINFGIWGTRIEIHPK
jgi:hypothetical protein